MSEEVAGHCSVSMLGRWALVSGAVVGLAACGTAPATRPAPTAATDDPAARARTALVQQQPFLVWGNLVDLVQQSDELEITQLDERAGYIVARYSGDPEPYVSCGPTTGSLEPVPAAAPAGSGATNGVLRLDGRLMVQVEPEGTDTLVTTRSTYVLTRFAGGAQADGAPRGHEIVSFGTGGQGEFAGGLVCEPTGQFERVVLSGLPDATMAGRREEEPAAPASGAADALSARVRAAVAGTPCAEVEPQFVGADRVRLTGYVESEADVDRLRAGVAQIAGIASVETALEVHRWPFCEILQITAPYREADGRNGGGLEVAVADGAGPVLLAGDHLALELALPPEAAYLYLGYVQHDGRVGHMATIPAREWAGTVGRFRYDTGFEAAEPFGREMIVAIASPRPLFDEPDAAHRSPERFVGVLREELAELAAAAPEQPIAAGHLFITTRAGDAGS